MEDKYKGLINKNEVIDGKYSVVFFIKQGSNAESYRVKGNDGKYYFLKLFNYAKIHRTAFDNENNLLEIELLKSINHSNIISYKDSGELIYGGKKYGYLVLDFIAGETLSERISRKPINTLFEIKQLVIGILNGLNYLHSLPEPIIHNEITPQNIMLDLSAEISKSIIVDFGYARLFSQSNKVFNKEGLNLNYVASECFNSIFSPQSDIYSVGAILYHLLFGLPPWFKDISMFAAEHRKMEESIIERRHKPLTFPDISKKFIDFDGTIFNIVKKALQQNPEMRFQTANEFIQALNGEIEIKDIDEKKPIEKAPVKPKGEGFKSIAGMQALKDLLTIDVINALKNPEKYKEYDISFPNGILFYGPPRCGKTFFAKKFAEEVGFNYMYKKPSDLKSKWVNESEEIIAKMFEEAEANAPTIIFIDELNEIVPNRQSDVHQMSKSAVNEMLAQMDRTGDKGIFVIGATNYPHMIDPAILGAGRLEKKFYIGPPDFDLRKELFKSYLKKKPLDFGIDYDRLAHLTENYVTGDIELITNEAAKRAMLAGEKVSMSILEKTIEVQKPTVPLSELQRFEQLRLDIENDTIVSKPKPIPRVGF
jgi:transitional endoplasmic reticulum ATPase